MDVNGRGRKYLWLFAVWPMVITAVPALLTQGGGTTYNLMMALTSVSVLLMLFSAQKRRERGFGMGVITGVGAISLSISLQGFGIITAVVLFSALITAGELTIHAIRIYASESGDGAEEIVREFMLGPGSSILKIGAAVILISAIVLLLMPVLAIWSDSIYLVMFFAAAAGLSGYYLITRQ